MSEVVRNVAAVAGAAGVAGLLLPLPRLRTEPQRAAAAALTLASWAIVIGTLVSGHNARAALDRFSSPARGAALAVAILIAIAVAVALVRVIVARPTVWFVLLAVTAPVRTPITVGSQEANLLVPLYAVILLGLIAWVWARARGRVGPAREGPWTLSVPLAAFLVFLLISVLWSADSDQGAIKAGCFYLPFALLYAVVVAWWPHARALPALAVTTVVGGVIAALVGIEQYLAKDIWWNESLQTANVYSRFFRVNGIFFDPNILGRYLVIAILACVALAWVRRRPREIAPLAAATVVMTIALAVTFSRSSALMLMVGLVMLAVRAIGPWRAIVTGVGLLAVASAIALASSENVRRAATSSDRLEHVSEGRFELMKGGLTIWRADPVVGVGLGGFEKRFEETLTPVEQRRVRVVISHNSPVTVLSEGGVVGFALFIALLIGAGWAAVRGSREEGVAGWGRWTLAAVMLGIFVHSLLYAALFEDPFLWIAAAAAVALAGARAAPGAGGGEAEPEPEPQPTAPVPVS
jgi:O-antigen ligase